MNPNPAETLPHNPVILFAHKPPGWYSVALLGVVAVLILLWMGAGVVTYEQSIRVVLQPDEGMPGQAFGIVPVISEHGDTPVQPGQRLAGLEGDATIGYVIKIDRDAGRQQLKVTARLDKAPSGSLGLGVRIMTGPAGVRDGILKALKAQGAVR